MNDHPPAYLPLCTRLDLARGIPFTPDWSAAPDFLDIIAGHCLATKPRVILECSSGLTTLVLARCCAMNGAGQVFSLENGPEYAETTRQSLRHYGLEAHATVIDAPLEQHSINGREYAWYATGGLPPVQADMLVIDGPPGFIQPHSRYPALPLLADRLAATCTLFLDDAARPDERDIVTLWLREFPGAQAEYRDTERGCAVLTLGR